MKADSIWGSHMLANLPSLTDPCEYADDFQEWASSQVEEVQYAREQFPINEKMLIITKKYREYMRHIPEDHHILAKETDHKCVYAVWDECCRALEEAELKLTPQLPEKPTPPIPPIDNGPSSSVIGEIYE